MSLILVVDDRAINREFLATLLGYCGHRVIEAADGAEALSLTRAQHPDLVVSDVLMPVMDGVEFANRLHADPSIADIPIIFYTATYRLKEGRILAQSCGVVSVLAKPAEPKAIIEAVDTALGNASQLPAPAPLPATTTLPARFAASKVSTHLGDLAELRLRIQKIVEAGLELIGEQGELRQVSEGLIQAFGTVQASSLRLAAVLELGLDLASERQPQQLLDLFCRAAQDIMNSRYASLCLGNGDGVLRAATRGMSEETSTFFRALDPRGGLLEQLLGEGRMRRLRDLDGRLARLGVAPPSRRSRPSWRSRSLPRHAPTAGCMSPTSWAPTNSARRTRNSPRRWPPNWRWPTKTCSSTNRPASTSHNSKRKSPNVGACRRKSRSAKSSSARWPKRRSTASSPPMRRAG